MTLREQFSKEVDDKSGNNLSALESLFLKSDQHYIPWLEKLVIDAHGRTKSDLDDLSPKYEYEIRIDDKGTPFEINDWIPIATDCIKDINRIEEYIQKGLIRKIETSKTAIKEDDAQPVALCFAGNCVAEEFRKKHPNYSFTKVGYSASPRELNKEYEELVDISFGDSCREITETHKCKICNKEVYTRTHR